jgi:ankyrin repeat protein
MVNFMLEKGVPADAASNRYTTPLHLAVKAGASNCVQRLIAAGADVNCRTDQFVTPLHQAAHDGNLHLIAELLDAGALIDAKDADGRTPLHWAARHARVPIMKLLLSRGADSCMEDRELDQAIHFAALADSATGVQLLLDAGVNVNARGAGGRTPMHVAVCANARDVGSLLTERGANNNFSDAQGRTPLHLACDYVREEMVAHLLGAHVRVDTTTDDGSTALHWACVRGSRELIRIILDRGASLEKENNDGFAPLHAAALADQAATCGYLITKRGEDVNRRSSLTALTPLHCACAAGSIATVQHLLDLGADVHATDAFGETPLFCAVRGGVAIAAPLGPTPHVFDLRTDVRTYISDKDADARAIKCVKLLVERGASLQTINRDGCTPLHVVRSVAVARAVVTACIHRALKKTRRDDTTAAETMVEDLDDVSLTKAIKAMAVVQAYIETQDNAAMTPLDFATQRGCLPVALWLVNRGALPPAVRIRRGLTVLCDVLTSRFRQLSASASDNTAATSAVQSAAVSPRQDGGETAAAPATPATPSGGAAASADDTASTPSSVKRTLRTSTRRTPAARTSRTDEVDPSTLPPPPLPDELPTPPSSGSKRDTVRRHHKRTDSPSGPRGVEGERGAKGSSRHHRRQQQQHQQQPQQQHSSQRPPLPPAPRVEVVDATTESQDESSTGLGQLRRTTGMSIRPGQLRQRYFTLLHFAVSMGQLRFARRLIERGFGANTPTPHGVTPLMIASRLNDISVVRLLLGAGGADVWAADDNGWTALDFAAFFGHGELLDILLREVKRHENVVEMLSGADRDGRTVLHRAVRCGEPNVVRALLAAGVRVDTRDDLGETPLHWAAATGDRDILEIMLGALKLLPASMAAGSPATSPPARSSKKTRRPVGVPRAGVNVPTASGSTPLHLVCYQGSNAAVELLLEAGALIDAATVDGRTPLSVAVEYGHAGTAMLLIVEGADCHCRDRRLQRTPLHWAVVSGFLDCIIQLVERGGSKSIDAIDSEQHTPLLLAVLNRHVEIATFLVKKGASLNIADKEANTPLHIAAGYGNQALVSLLVNKGAQLQLLNDQQQTPLHLAAISGCRPAMSMIVNRVRANASGLTTTVPTRATQQKSAAQDTKLNIDAVDAHGHTPIYLACVHRRKECVRYLLEEGASLEIEDNKGRTPLEYTIENDYFELTQLIEEMRKRGSDASTTDGSGSVSATTTPKK